MPTHSSISDIYYTHSLDKQDFKALRIACFSRNMPCCHTIVSGSLGVSRGLSGSLGERYTLFHQFFWLKALEASFLSNQIMKIYSCLVHSFVLYSSDTFFLVLAFKLFFTLKDLQHLFTGYKLNLKLCQSQN